MDDILICFGLLFSLNNTTSESTSGLMMSESCNFRFWNRFKNQSLILVQNTTLFNKLLVNYLYIFLPDKLQPPECLFK